MLLIRTGMMIKKGSTDPFIIIMPVLFSHVFHNKGGDLGIKFLPKSNLSCTYLKENDDKEEQDGGTPRLANSNKSI
jgi:hypothetical protein